MSSRRLAPNARRTPISMARPAPRASRRFAMLAHAMSSTIAVTVHSISNGACASRCIELCPRRPGVSTTRFTRNSAIIWSGIPFCSGASTSVTIEW